MANMRIYAEGAIKIVLNANKIRTPLRVILSGLGKDAAKIISETAYSNGDRAKVRCYGSDSVPEGVAIMRLENMGVSITGKLQ